MTSARSFLPPNSIELYFVGDSISEGDVRECAAGEVLSPAELFLGLTPGFPSMDGFIRKMSYAYKGWANHKLYFPCQEFPRWEPNVGELHPGSIVACINRNKTPQQEKEIVRAKIIRKFEVYETLANEEGHVYRVLFLDLGVYDRVNLKDMFLLHRDFTSQPCWGIKSRFIMDRYISHYDMGCRNVEAWNWPRGTRRLMADVLTTHDCRLRVRFVREVKGQGPNVKGEDVWEVSILSVNPVHPLIMEARSVDEQIIDRSFDTRGYFRLMQRARNVEEDSRLR